jgi:VIT1/CCC1 family predicted Fe2+/Mn2+ transporter
VELFYFILFILIAENNIIGQRNALVQAHYRILLDFSNTKESGLVLLLKMTIGESEILSRPLPQ